MTALISLQTNSQTNCAFVLFAVICIALSQYTDIVSPKSLFNSSTDLWSLIIDSSFAKALIASFAVIIFSELGDKTFFISAIMAMKNSRTTIFFASMTANVVMNAISVLLGVITQVIPKSFINYLSILLFAFFGFKMIYESCSASDGETNEELEDAENELKKLESNDSQNYTSYKRILSKVVPFLSFVFIETFCLIFFAEWGDRSQISTIVLAAREDPTGVIVGSLFGYSVCTAIAVLGGRLMAQIISIKTVTLIGGLLFLTFAVLALLLGQ